MVKKNIAYLSDGEVIVIKYYFYRLKRLYKFIKFAMTSYDFDYGYTEKLLLMHLKMLLTQLEKDSSFVEYEPTDLKSLRLAIKLLSIEDYSKFYDLHVKEWGNSEMHFTPSGKNTSVLNFVNAKAMELNKVDEEKKLRLEAYFKDTRIEHKRNLLAYKIIMKYKDRWWS